jgi:hypothetical protein
VVSKLNDFLVEIGRPARRMEALGFSETHLCRGGRLTALRTRAISGTQQEHQPIAVAKAKKTRYITKGRSAHSRASLRWSNSVCKKCFQASGVGLLFEFANSNVAKADFTAVILKRNMTAQGCCEFWQLAEPALFDQFLAIWACKIDVDNLVAV